MAGTRTTAAAASHDAPCILSDRLPLAPWRVILSCGALDARDVTRLSSCSRTCLARARREDVWAALHRYTLASPLRGAYGGAALRTITPAAFITTRHNDPHRRAPADSHGESACPQTTSPPGDDDATAVVCTDTHQNPPTGAHEPATVALASVSGPASDGASLAGAGGSAKSGDAEPPSRAAAAAAAAVDLPPLPESCLRVKDLCAHSRRDRKWNRYADGHGVLREAPPAICRALMIGARGSGKDLLQQCVFNGCNGIGHGEGGYVGPGTLGVDFAVYQVVAEPLSEGDDVSGPDGNPLAVRIQLWQDYGMMFHRSLPLSLLRGLDHLVLCYSLTDADDTLADAREFALRVLTMWDEALRADKSPFVETGAPQVSVVGSFADAAEGVVPERGDDAYSFAAELAACTRREVPVMAVNARTGQGVKEFMLWLGSSYATQTKGAPEGYRAPGGGGDKGCAVM